MLLSEVNFKSIAIELLQLIGGTIDEDKDCLCCSIYNKLTPSKQEEFKEIIKKYYPNRDEDALGKFFGTHAKEFYTQHLKDGEYFGKFTLNEGKVLATIRSYNTIEL